MIKKGYYITPDNKIYYVRRSGAIVQENIFPKVFISEEEFKSIEKRQFKSDKANEILNIFYKTVEHTWKWNYSTYKKLPNFEDDGYSFNSNYKNIPYHDVDVYGKCYLVWYRGRVYYHSISYGGYPQGELIDIETGNSVKWCKLKHCAPILNVNTNKIA